MARAVWIYFLSKFTEFLDTFFFIARKKFANVSALQVSKHVFSVSAAPSSIPFPQVIHHGIMPVFAYCQCRWLPGGHESFGGFLNSIVHVIMYSYYFLAALGPGFQRYLWWKKYLTTFQMVQVSERGD